MKKICIVSLILMLLVCSCRTAGTPAVQTQTQLQTREFQTRTYETNNVKMVMKAMVNVLQDDNFIIKTANAELGVLSATKDVNIMHKGEAIAQGILFGANARYKKNRIVEATANVSEFGKQSKVRVNFQYKDFDNAGAVLNVYPIQDAKTYQDFFSKVDKGIFIQKEGL